MQHFAKRSCLGFHCEPQAANDKSWGEIFFQTTILILLTFKHFGHQIIVKLFTKKSSGFQPFFKVPRIEWCAIGSGARNPNPWVKSILKMLKESSASQLHGCPYIGRLVFTNVKVVKEMSTFFPAGVYRFVFEIMNDNLKVLQFSTLYEVFDL